jgi:hypothetical protein
LPEELRHKLNALYGSLETRNPQSVVVACRNLLADLHAFDRQPALQSHVNTIRAFESETDGFPVGSTRDMWDGQALSTKDQELAAYMARMHSALLLAVSKLVQNLSD